MSSKKKTEKLEDMAEEVKEEVTSSVEETEIPQESQKQELPKEEKTPEEPKKSAKKSKFKVGDLVFIHKDADADLNGFKLFPQYKKYTYTVEAYDENTGVYSLRRLNLSLKLKEELILAPSERAHDSLNRKQF